MRHFLSTAAHCAIVTFPQTQHHTFFLELTMSPHLAYAISTSQIALVGFSVGTAGFGYIAFPYVGHAARLWDAKKRELVSAGAGGIGDVWDV